MPGSPQFRLQTFGGSSRQRNLQPCILACDTGRALLAYLAAQPGDPHARDPLATMSWPDLDREAALPHLRDVSCNLRLTPGSPDDARSRPAND